MGKIVFFLGFISLFMANGQSVNYQKLSRDLPDFLNKHYGFCGTWENNSACGDHTCENAAAATGSSLSSSLLLSPLPCWIKPYLLGILVPMTGVYCLAGPVDAFYSMWSYDKTEALFYKAIDDFELFEESALLNNCEACNPEVKTAIRTLYLMRYCDKEKENFYQNISLFEQAGQFLGCRTIYELTEEEERLLAFLGKKDIIKILHQIKVLYFNGVQGETFFLNNSEVHLFKLYWYLTTAKKFSLTTYNQGTYELFEELKSLMSNYSH